MDAVGRIYACSAVVLVGCRVGGVVVAVGLIPGCSMLRFMDAIAVIYGCSAAVYGCIMLPFMAAQDCQGKSRLQPDV